ncbi:MAG TPA: hypothetical protein VHO46_00760 [Bacteroidales bacterium]|nr:hypothetical protein [Bacteroidales bacterium]
MNSLLRFSVSLVLVLLFAGANANDPLRIVAGAAEAGMNYACVTQTSFWSSFHNQASLAFNKDYSAGFSYADRFGLKELSTRSAGVVIPAGRTSIGALYSNFGYSDFRRHAAGLACGLKLSGKLAAGVEADYFDEKTYGEYEERHAITFQAGVMLMPRENIRIGLQLFNPLPESLSDSYLPSSIRVGAGLQLNSDLFAAAEAEMNSKSGFLARMGFEYEALKKLFIRGGFCSQNTSFSFGLGYRLKFVQLDLGFITHDRLGVSSSASMIFKIR